MAMTIAVCVKQVPDSSEVSIHPQTNTLLREGVDSMINPFDTYALEEAVRLREQIPGSRVIVLSMGPPQVMEALREAISLGADEAVLLCDSVFAGSDTWSTSLVLATALRQIRPDLVLCGKQAIDGDTAQIGPGIAAHNGWPQVCYVNRIEQVLERTLVVSRRLEEGQETVEVELPCLLTVVKELNQPRMPTLSGRRRAREAEISLWDHHQLELDPGSVGLAGSPTRVKRIFAPAPRTGGIRVEAATAEEQAKELIRVLSEGKPPRSLANGGGGKKNSREREGEHRNAPSPSSCEARMEIDATRCTGCATCLRHCPLGAITMSERQATVGSACIFCGACVDSCPVNAITLHPPVTPADSSADYRGVWVFAEQKDGVISPVVFELIGKARQLADEVREEVVAVLLGEGLSSAVEALKVTPVSRILLVEAPLLSLYAAEPYSRVLADLIALHKPSILLAGATAIGRSLLARVAVFSRTGLTADCTALEIESGELLQIRPAFGGNIMAEIRTPGHRPQMATVRHRVFPDVRQMTLSGRWAPAVVERVITTPELLRTRTRRISLIREAENLVNIAEADIIVAGGRGVGGREGLALLQELATVLGGSVGASRAAVDQQWLPYAHQVGQTGITVAPRIYFAIGISGAIQHRVGMRGSEIIVAINVDPSAPIFDIADYGVVGDLFEIVPAIIQECKAIHS